MLIERFGYGTARGLSSRGAKKALLQLVRQLEAGRAVGFTLDGPRGPARQAHTGAVWLAGTTGQPILPFHLEAARHWTLRSWDRTQIPKPFSLVSLAVGRPLEVPHDPDEGTIEAKRRELEAVLDVLSERALQMLREPSAPGRVPLAEG